MLPVSISSHDSRIVYRKFPSGATLALTHSDLLSNDAHDLDRIECMYEAMAVALGVDQLADASKFDKVKLKACSDVLELFLEEFDRRTALWQTCLRAEYCLPARPLDSLVRTAAAAMVAEFGNTLTTYAFMHNDVAFHASPAWMALDTRDRLHLAAVAACGSSALARDLPIVLLHSANFGSVKRGASTTVLVSPVRFVSIALDEGFSFHAVCSSATPTLTDLMEAAQRNPHMTALATMVRQSQTELARGIPFAFALDSDDTYTVFGQTMPIKVGKSKIIGKREDSNILIA